jgi:uncharacterized protein YfbU (UPF0304 family)
MHASADELELTRKERLMLWNQYSILEVLQPKNAEHYQKLKIILERGYKLHYPDLLLHIDEDDFSDKGAREVIRILGMFEVIQDSLANVGSVEGVENHMLRFAGFDGNNEADQLGYLHFLVEQQERFKHVVANLRDYNSHAPLLTTYRKMLGLYERLGSPRLLGAEGLKELASVWQRLEIEYA